jgi:hypothetical protein
MFNPTLIVTEAFIRELRMMYERTYGTMEPGYPGSRRVTRTTQSRRRNVRFTPKSGHR